MGAVENAQAWRDKQSNPEDYTVYGPHTYDTPEKLNPPPIRVFIEAGKGNINIGENPYYAEEHKDQECDVGHWTCWAEGGVVVAYVVKKS